MSVFILFFVFALSAGLRQTDLISKEQHEECWKWFPRFRGSFNLAKEQPIQALARRTSDKIVECIFHQALKPSEWSWLFSSRFSGEDRALFTTTWTQITFPDCFESLAVCQNASDDFPSVRALAKEHVAVCERLGLALSESCSGDRVRLRPKRFEEILKEILSKQSYQDTVFSGDVESSTDPATQQIYAADIDVWRALKLIKKRKLTDADFVKLFIAVFESKPISANAIFEVFLLSYSANAFDMGKASYIIMIASLTEILSDAEKLFAKNTAEQLVAHLTSSQSAKTFSPDFRVLGMWLLDSRPGLYKTEITNAFLKSLEMSPVNTAQTLDCLQLLDDGQYSGNLAEQIFKLVLKNTKILRRNGELSEEMESRLASLQTHHP